VPEDPINSSNLNNGLILTLDPEFEEMEKKKGKKFYEKVPSWISKKAKIFGKKFRELFKRD